MEGEVRGRALGEALQAIGRQRKTGILTVQGTDEIIALSFLDGAIVGADALNRSLEDGLGEVLASQHLVDPEEFARLAAEQEAGGGRVVDLLVERSYLSRAQLLDGLRRHTYRLCLEALSWNRGEFRFYQGDEVAYEAGVEPLSVSELMVRAGEELGQAGPLGIRIPSPEDVVRPVAGADREAGSPAHEAHGGLGAAALWALLDGTSTLREVAAHSGMPEFEVRRAVGQWLDAGLVEPVTAGPAAAPPEVPSGPQPPGSASPASEPLLDLELPAVLEAPEPSPEPRRRRARPRTASRAGGAQVVEAVQRWATRLFGVGLLIASLVLLVVSPQRILLPFPWQGSLRQGLANVQRAAERRELEDGARIFFLLHGRFPDTLAELAALGITGRDREQWRLTSGPTSLVLQPAGDDRGAAVEQPSWTTAVAGDFLLDPAFFESGQAAEGPLLVLLD